MEFGIKFLRPDTQGQHHHSTNLWLVMLLPAYCNGIPPAKATATLHMLLYIFWHSNYRPIKYHEGQYDSLYLQT